MKLYSHKGISIIEIIVVLMILGLILSALIPGIIDRIDRAKYEKMINEMTSIAQASIDFYNSQYPNSWPTNIGQLVPKYLFQNNNTSPWQGSYVLSFPNNTFTLNTTNLVVVSTIIPSGIANMNPEGSMVSINRVSGTNTDQISIALSVPNEGIGMAQYEKKYLYNQ